MSTTMKISQQLIDEFVLQSHQNFGKVRHFLILHPDLVTKRASWGETALQAARHTGQTDIEHFLISAGATESTCNGNCDAPIERLDENHNLRTS